MFQFIQKPESRVNSSQSRNVNGGVSAERHDPAGEQRQEAAPLDLGHKLNARLGAAWRDGTAETVARKSS